MVTRFGKFAAFAGAVLVSSSMALAEPSVGVKAGYVGDFMSVKNGAETKDKAKIKDFQKEGSKFGYGNGFEAGLSFQPSVDIPVAVNMGVNFRMGATKEISDYLKTGKYEGELESATTWSVPLGLTAWVPNLPYGVKPYLGANVVAPFLSWNTLANKSADTKDAVKYEGGDFGYSGRVGVTVDLPVEGLFVDLAFEHKRDTTSFFKAEKSDDKKDEKKDKEADMILSRQSNAFSVGVGYNIM